MLGIAQGDDIVQPTNPYYRTSYAAAYQKGRGARRARFAQDPRLKTAKIGVVAGTPPVTYLATGGLLPQIKSYALVVDTRFDSPAQQMMDDLEKGDIDVALLWGPIAGYYAAKATDPDHRHAAREGAERAQNDLSDRHGRTPFGPELETRAQ